MSFDNTLTKISFIDQKVFLLRSLGLFLLISLFSVSAKEVHVTNNLDSGPGSFRAALTLAEQDPKIYKILFEDNFTINLAKELIYMGKQEIAIDGKRSIIDGADVDTHLANLLTFRVSNSVTLKNFTFRNSKGSGLVVEIDPESQGNITVSLEKITVANAALYGIHIDDNFDTKDKGNAGSMAGIRLNVSDCAILNNGNGDVDHDGIRIDERGDGDIIAYVSGTQIDRNGGDGFELDEGGNGNVELTMIDSHLNFNGSLNPEDLDDGLDIDEAGNGDVHVTLIGVHSDSNYEEGIDLDELDAGSIELTFYDVHSDHNAREGIHVDEDNTGDIIAYLSHVEVNNLGQQGLRIEQQGSGEVYSQLIAVHSSDQVYQPDQNSSGSRETLLAWLHRQTLP